MYSRIEMPKVACEWWFYIITILATFNCLKRPDWNFAFGLLSYFMMKSIDKTNIEEIGRVKIMLIVLNVGLIVFDLVWIITLGTVWHGKPTHDKIIWEGFSGLHNFIITLSAIIIVIRAISLIFLCLIQGNAYPSSDPAVRNTSPTR